eukprot:TRINITY_DN8321_c0_g1_i1.p1 TRINITY_DN8321_c0_g1~~TRINITY_DN8321_c0_g1_i1.p1  ORF type:complete len:643 (+),score=196.04 TRINITY_DN8321_c0_g1_i1:67-1995(+)
MPRPSGLAPPSSIPSPPPEFRSDQQEDESTAPEEVDESTAPEEVDEEGEEIGDACLLVQKPAPEGAVSTDIVTPSFAHFLHCLEHRRPQGALLSPACTADRCANAYLHSAATCDGVPPPQLPEGCTDDEIWSEVRFGGWQKALFLGVAALRLPRGAGAAVLSAVDGLRSVVSEGGHVSPPHIAFCFAVAAQLLLSLGTEPAARAAAALAGDVLAAEPHSAAGVAVWLLAVAQLGSAGSPLCDAAARARTVAATLAQLEVPYLAGHPWVAEGAAELLMACGEADALDKLVERHAAGADWPELLPAHRSRMRRLQALAWLQCQGPPRGVPSVWPPEGGPRAAREAVALLRCRESFPLLPPCAADAAAVMAALKCAAPSGCADAALQELTDELAAAQPLPGAATRVVCGCCWLLLLGGRGREAQQLLRTHREARASADWKDFPFSLFPPPAGADRSVDAEALDPEQVGSDLWQLEAMMCYVRAFKMHCALLSARRRGRDWAAPEGPASASDPFNEMLSRCHEFVATHVLWSSGRLAPPASPAPDADGDPAPVLLPRALCGPHGDVHLYRDAASGRALSPALASLGVSPHPASSPAGGSRPADGYSDLYDLDAELASPSQQQAAAARPPAAIPVPLVAGQVPDPVD